MTQEFYHEFKGFGRVPSRILVKIFSDDGENLILFEDIDEGTSVTNASEQLASEIVNQMNFDPDECSFFETYSQHEYEDFDKIEYTWSRKSDGKWEARNPMWKPSSEEIRKMFKN
jgi:hypothetical protein